MDYFYNLILFPVTVGLSTYFYFTWDTQDIMKKIFYVGTDAYTYCRLSYQNILGYLPKITWGEQPIIQRILLIKNRSFTDLSHYCENIDNLTWKELCGDGEDHVDTRLEIHYTIKDREYIIVFPKEISICLPDFPEEVLESPKSLWDEWETVTIEDVEPSDDKIYTILDKYAGPVGDFHQSIHGFLLLENHWIMDHEEDEPVSLVSRNSTINLIDPLGRRALHFFNKKV